MINRDVLLLHRAEGMTIALGKGIAVVAITRVFGRSPRGQRHVHATADMERTIACPSCDGTGAIAHFVYWVGEGRIDPAARCFLCGGTGHVSLKTMNWHARGQAQRDARRLRGESIAKLAMRLDLRPIQVTAMERGVADPLSLEAGEA